MKKLKAEERKKQIVKCAVKIFAKSNYKSTRVSNIAKEAGISEAAVYKYFPKKEAIYLEILEHIFRRVVTVWEEEYQTKENIPDLIRSMPQMYFSRMINHPDELKLHFQAISEVDVPAIADRLHKDHEYYLGFFRKILQKGIREGSIRKDIDIESVSWIFDAIGVIMNIARLLKFDKEFDQKTISNMTEMLIKSIQA
jgi:AcrR family transcriptional regulator